jgi:hypothetical protein
MKRNQQHAILLSLCDKVKKTLPFRDEMSPNKKGPPGEGGPTLTGVENIIF